MFIKRCKKCQKEEGFDAAWAKYGPDILDEYDMHPSERNQLHDELLKMAKEAADDGIITAEERKEIEAMEKKIRQFRVPKVGEYPSIGEEKKVIMKGKSPAYPKVVVAPGKLDFKLVIERNGRSVKRKVNFKFENWGQTVRYPQPLSLSLT